MKRYWTVAAMLAAFMVLAGVFAFILSIAFVGFGSSLFGLAYRNLMVYISGEVALLLGVGFSAFLVMRYWERVPFSDLGLAVKGRMKDFLWGTLTAAVLYIIGFGLSLMLGVVEVAGVHFDALSLLYSWIFMLLVAVTEEAAMRGFVLGRLLNAGVGRYWALLISATLFSLIHLFNPNFGFLPFLNILLAGLLLGASYLYTRNLWFPIGLHLFWNWIQGPILGYQVSGGVFGTTLLTLRLPEENIINGGAFGFEGSIICTALIVVFTILILKVASSRCACVQGRL